MPRFDFTCRDCHTSFEESIPFGSKDYPPCPSCGAHNTEKQLAKPLGIVFKGGGFYKTDSNGSPKPDSANSDQKADQRPKTAENPPIPPTSEGSK